MSGSAHKPQAAAVVDEEEDNSPEVGQQQQDNLTEEVPESAMISGFFSGGLALVGAQAASRLEVIRAFDGVNSKTFKYNLLNVRDPQKFQQALRDHALVKAELQGQKKRDKKGTSKKAVIGFGPYRREMEYSAFEKKDQALQIGAAVQTHVTTEERFIRTQQAFGLDDEHAKKLREGYKQWQTQNKGKGIDAYIASSDARNIYQAQFKKLGKKLDDKTEEDGIKYARQSDNKSRVEAIKNSKDSIKAGQTEINDILDSGNVYTQEQIDKKAQAVDAAQETTGQPKPATPQVPIPTPVPPPTPPVKPSFFTKHFPRISNTFNIVNSTINSIKSKIASGIVSALSKTVLKGVMRSAVGMAIKSGIGAALGVATGGASVAISVGWEVLKKLPVIGKLFDMIEGALVGLVKGLVIIIIAVPLMLLFFSIFLIPHLFNQFVSGNQKTVYSPLYEQAENWKSFENSLFTLENNQKITWDQMEKNLFTLPDSYLSLDSDRHDQVKK